MQKTDVLILVDGIVAKHFITRILEDITTTNHYHIVHIDEELKPQEFGDNFFFYHFDPTSFVKLSKLFTKNFKQVVIVLGNKIDTLASYENIRKLDRNVSVVLFDRWDLEIDDKNCIKIEANEILANRLFDYLPNVPVIAQNVGLGHGEIMEVLVPFGSSYVYRHIGTIEQKGWKIAAIYRNNRLILPTSNLMIYPNDLLLLIGEPEVLKQVFKSIKREVGQFPLPYGANSYLFVDMEASEENQIKHMLLETIYLHKKLNDKKLFVRVANPNNFKLLEFLQRYECETIDVMIDYRYRSQKELINEDLSKIRVGLFLIAKELFKDVAKELFIRKIPTLLLSRERMANINEAALVLKADKQLEKISSPLFDLAIQLDLEIALYEDQSIEQNDTLKSIIEHFENLAHIFSKKVSIRKSKTNVIKELMRQERKLIVYPFTEEVVKANRFNIFCTDPWKLHYKLDRFHQIFIPSA